MTNESFRCDCLVTSALDIIGDKWTLVIIKQMIFEGKRTFKDFTESAESIASNILSSRLKKLESYNLIRKEKLANNKKTNIYILTESGLNLMPVIVEMAIWSYDNMPEFHPILTLDNRSEMMLRDKKSFIKMLIDRYKEQQKEFMKS